jgi:cobalt-zinc-cadmium efflux system outer membrane protein
MLLRLIPVGMLCALTGPGVLIAPATAVAETAAFRTEQNVLTLEEVLARTLQSNSNLVAAAEDLRAAEAEQRQAGRLLNPELSITLENVAGNDVYAGTEAAELTVELSQPVELAGKRGLRREAAGIQCDLAANEQSRSRADVLATSRQRYIKALAAQNQLALAREQMELAGKSLLAAEERIKAGKSPAIDRLRLQGEFNLAMLAVEQAERTVKTARLELVASWNAATPDFDRVAGDLATLPELPTLTEIETTQQQTPEAASRRLATALSTVELAQAKAARIPDPSLTVGWRQFEESNENALLFGISLPLPLFNQGQDSVAAAGSRLNGAQAREQSARNELLVQLRGAWQALADARAAADTFNYYVVPGAAESFSAAEFGYQAGKFGLIELLDAQRALFEARQRQLAAQTAAHLAASELQRLLGRAPAPVAIHQPSSL